MAAPTEEVDSTGVAVVNASDFLLLCLCLAAAISLWKLLVRRRREREQSHHEVKRKGSYQASNLQRSQSPPLPREQPKPKTKPRTTIVFDEWDGAPRPPPPLSPLSRHLNECFYLFISPRKHSCTAAITQSLRPLKSHAGSTRVVVLDEPYGECFRSCSITPHQRLTSPHTNTSHCTGPNFILRSLRLAPDNRSR